MQFSFGKINGYVPHMAVVTGWVISRQNKSSALLFRGTSISPWTDKRSVYQTAYWGEDSFGHFYLEQKPRSTEPLKGLHILENNTKFAEFVMLISMLNVICFFDDCHTGM